MPFEFPGVVESMEEVPEEYKAGYAGGTGENAEKFVITGIAKTMGASILSLNKTLDGTRADKKTATDESAGRRVALKSFETLAGELGIEVLEGNVLDGFKNHLTDLTVKVKNGKEMGINLEKVKVNADKMVEERVGVADAKTAKMFKSLTDALIGDVAVRALTEAGAASIDLLLPHLQQKCKVVLDEATDKYVVRVLDADGEARSDGKGGWLSLAGLALEMKADTKYAPAFKSEDKGGTGTKTHETKRTITDKQNQGEKSSVDKISAGIAELQKR